MFGLQGKAMWVVQISNPEESPESRAERLKPLPYWRNRGIAVLAETCEGAMKRTREEFKACKILSINKHCNQVYIEKLLPE